MNTSKSIKWTFSSLGCPAYTLPETVALAKANGLTRLELRALEDRVDLPALFRERYKTPEALRDYLANEGVEVVSLDTSLKLVGNTPSDREAFLEFLPWAQALGTPYLRVFDGGAMVESLDSADLEAAVATINWWREERKKSGWKSEIMVETHDCLTKSSAIQQLQAALEEPVEILWDTHHTWKKGGEDPAETWEIIRANVPHIHVKDSISQPSERHPITYVQLGDGEFDLEGTLGILSSSGYDGVVSIEWERKWHPYLSPMEETLKRARELGWW